MGCARQFFGISWEHHAWRKRVTGYEILRALEPDMWARPVPRDFVRCDKEDVCSECGKVRHRFSCHCDLARGERCPLLLEYKEAHSTGELAPA
jgi:hypothetical protein